MKSKISISKYCHGARRRVQRLQRGFLSEVLQEKASRAVTLINELDRIGGYLEKAYTKERKMR